MKLGRLWVVLLALAAGTANAVEFGVSGMGRVPLFLTSTCFSARAILSSPGTSSMLEGTKISTSEHPNRGSVQQPKDTSLSTIIWASYWASQS